jgi:kynurenine formamidase
VCDVRRLTQMEETNGPTEIDSASPGTTRPDATSVLKALGIPRTGVVYDLSSGWWTGMPNHPAHPRFEVMTYRSPQGLRNQQDLEFLAPSVNTIGYGFVSELIIGTAHTGTHIDAMCHVTRGSRAEWHGGVSAFDKLGDRGALTDDAAELPVIISRGVMLDVAGAAGRDSLAARFPVGSAELEAACARQSVSITRGTVVLVRTGHMRHWPDPERMRASEGAGISLDGAKWLSERGVAAVGADTGAIEVEPSGIAGTPQPVHVHLIIESGIPILEWVYCEELAESEVWEFLFCALPLPIKGATGSMIRPVAIA